MLPWHSSDGVCVLVANGAVHADATHEVMCDDRYVMCDDWYVMCDDPCIVLIKVIAVLVVHSRNCLP